MRWGEIDCLERKMAHDPFRQPGLPLVKLCLTSSLAIRFSGVSSCSIGSIELNIAQIFRTADSFSAKPEKTTSSPIMRRDIFPMP